MKPLADLRIIAIEQYGAGPFGSVHLADLGRYVPPYQEDGDVVFSNLRGHVPAKIGITYDELKGVKSKVVGCALTDFGMTGPRSTEPGYDYIWQGIAVWIDITGELVAAIAILAGVHAARRDGVGMDCDVSLFEPTRTRSNGVPSGPVNSVSERLTDEQTVAESGPIEQLKEMRSR